MQQFVALIGRVTVCICFAFALLSCATTGTSSDSMPAFAADSTKSINTPATPPPTASLDVSRRALGLVFRDLTEQTNAGLVLMNGLENIPIERLNVNNDPLPVVLAELSKLTGLVTHETPYYTFMFDPTYESLVTLNIKRQIPEIYDDVWVFAAFGADTPLFSVFAMLSRLTGKTLIADNAIGDALCGELNLHDVPLPQAIEAALQSARIPQHNFRIRATDGYIFLHSSAHQLRRNVASSKIPPESRKLLNEKCSISLLVYTEADNKIRSQLGASKLYKVLSELSLQLGMPVRADPLLDHFPVNPMVMNNVSRETALELLIHQWLVPEFEFTVVDGAVLIRPVGSG